MTNLTRYTSSYAKQPYRTVIFSCELTWWRWLWGESKKRRRLSSRAVEAQYCRGRDNVQGSRYSAIQFHQHQQLIEFASWCPLHSETMKYDGAEGFKFGGGNTDLDESVITGKIRHRHGAWLVLELTSIKLPKGCKILATESHGVSFWANTSRIEVELSDGTPQSFFIKAIWGDR